MERTQGGSEVRGRVTRASAQSVASPRRSPGWGCGPVGCAEEGALGARLGGASFPGGRAPSASWLPVLSCFLQRPPPSCAASPGPRAGSRPTMD